jgi:hypothetical protein
MNELTKFLLKELLDEPQTVAIYGGGFKPPTKGHFTVAKQILSDFPEIDELKIFVGKGIRDGIRITQDKSIQIWDIYKNYLSDKVNVEPSPQGEPTMDVIRYAKKHPEEKIYWFLGARDGDEGDIKDVEQRKNLLKKYPEVTNVEVKVITSTGGISGTKTRQALKAGDKEQFFQFIPDIEEKEQIWDIIYPLVKEEITPDQIKQADAFADKQLAPIDVDLTSKHVFDRLTGRDSDVTLAQLIGFFKRLGQNKKEFFDFFKKYKEIVATDKRTDLNIPFLNMTNKAIAKTIMRKDNFMSSSPKLVFEVGEANLKPYKWKEVDVDGWVTYVEFTTESETEYSVDIATVPYFDNDLNNYKALEIEFLAKPKDAQGSSAKIIVNKGELYRVMATITDIIKYYVKKFKAKAISYSPSKKSDEEDFGSQRDNLYRAFISKAIPGVRFEKNSNFITAILPDKTLNEGKQVGILYHYTSADGLKGILSSNRIKASEEIYMGQNLYYVSFTRNKNFHKKGSKFGVKTEYRITLDGDKLSNKYKITPHAYKPGYDYTENWEYDWLEDEPENVVRDFFDATGEYDEQEERISFKGPEGSIDNIKNYILAVDKVEDLQENNLPRLNEGRYDSITNKLSKLAFAAFKDIHDRGDKKGTFSFIVGPKSEYEEEQPDIQSDEFEFDFNGIVVITKDLYVVDGGANAGFDNEGDEIQP